MDDITSIFFITKVIQHRIPVFAMKDYALVVIENLNFYRKKFGFGLYGYVIMPEHYHLVIDTKGKTSIRKIKEDMDKYIARTILKDMKNNHCDLLQRFIIEPRVRKGHQTQEYGLFQKGGVDFEILRNEKLLEKNRVYSSQSHAQGDGNADGGVSILQRQKLYFRGSFINEHRSIATIENLKSGNNCEWRSGTAAGREKEEDAIAVADRHWTGEGRGFNSSHGPPLDGRRKRIQ